MAEYKVRVNDQERSVEISGEGVAREVLLDGQALGVRYEKVGPGRYSLLTGTRQFEASVVASGTSMDVYLGGKWFHVQVVDPHKGGLLGEGLRGTGPSELVAAMPGKVVRILVEPGQVVEPSDGIMVVEAMKMENELRAEVRAEVDEIVVSEGELVESGAVLVRFRALDEPAAS